MTKRNEKKAAFDGSNYLCKLAQNALHPIIVDVLPRTNDVPVLERALLHSDLDEDLFFILSVPDGLGCPKPSFSPIDKAVLDDTKTRVMDDVDKRWAAIPESTKEALVEWYNTAAEDLGPADKAALAGLYEGLRFVHGLCAHCNKPYQRANPDKWDHFQGRHNDEGKGELCANCTGLYMDLKEAAGE